MSQYYNAKREKGLYESVGKSFDSAQDDNIKPFKLSRSKIDLFIQCPRCFYLDRRLGVGRPPGFPFALNSAVDALLKQEFDIHRVAGTRHPLIEEYGLDARPVAHDDLEKWRHNFTGVQYHHEKTNFLVYGAIDDLWINSAGEYIVVDYKATAKEEAITALDKDWHDGYKRQMEIYQWLLRKNGYKVSNTGYFVYCNGKADRQAFDKKLDFDVTLIPYTGNDSWVEGKIIEAYQCLNQDKMPLADSECDYCAYTSAVDEVSGTKTKKSVQEKLF